MTLITGQRLVARRMIEYFLDEERQLLILRRAWLPVMIVVIALFMLAVPVFYDQVKTACVDPNCHDWQRPARPPGATPSLRFYALYAVVREAITVAIFCVMALFLALRGKKDRMALLTAIVLVMFAGGVIPDSLFALASTGVFWRVVVSLLGYLGSIGLLFYFCVFPNGRFAPSWTRWVFAVGVCFSTVTYAVPESSRISSSQPLSVLIYFSLLAILAVGQWRRFRTFSTARERQQTKWIFFGFGTALAGLVVAVVVLPMIGPDVISNRTMFRLVGQTIASSFLLLVPVSIALGVMKYRLWDIDFFINRVLVYVSLTSIVATVYMLTVAALGSLIPASGDTFISLLATGLLAVLFQPIRIRLQRGVNRLLYGERDDPYGVLSRLGERLGSSIDQQDVLPTIVDTVVQALRVPYAAIVFKGHDADERAINHGLPVGEPLVWPLLYQQERVGELHISTRGPSEEFSDSDCRLLDNFARQAGAAIHSVRLSTELQRSRERIVVAREEERRRLRRDLHDGLGPQLASQTLTLDAARKLMPTDPVHADHLLDELGGHIQASILDIRKLVYALRPPSLDELGLIGAIGETARRMENAGTRFTIAAPVSLFPLPAAIEVAALRISQEAMTNVIRHAGADSCTVRVVVEDDGPQLVLEIEDDGFGVPIDHEIGVGLLSMRERATELGGTCMIEPMPERGTRVRARLPLKAQS